MNLRKQGVPSSFFRYRNWEFLEQRDRQNVSASSTLTKKDKKWIVLPASAKCRLNCLCLCLTVTECPSGCLVNDPIPKADSLLWSIFDHDGNTRLEACCSHKLVQFSLLAYFFFFRYFFGQTNTGPYSHVEKWCGFISTSGRSPENDMIKTKEVEKKCVLW